MSDPSRRAIAVGLLSMLVAVDGAGPVHERGHAGPFWWLTGSLRDRVLDVVDPDEIVERLDIDALLRRVDVDGLLRRVDVDGLLRRVDVDALLRRVDVDGVVGRVDLDAVLERVDVERVVQRAGIPDIVAESTTSVLERTLDVVRRQLLGVDVVLARAIARLLSRDERSLQAGPTELVGDDRRLPLPGTPAEDVHGDYAGAVTRSAAFAIDWALAVGSFTIVSGALGSVLGTLGVGGGGGVLLSGVALLWLFTYWWTSTAVVGRTPGMAIIGLRIVTRAGAPVSGGRAFIRVLTMPLSFALFGLGLVGIVVDRERRALHDVLAGSTVVYDWGARTATMPTPLARWLEKRAAPVQQPTGRGRD
ncbi:MAG TPA: RDD family protein [Euzebyales bacterium]